MRPDGEIRIRLIALLLNLTKFMALALVVCSGRLSAQELVGTLLEEDGRTPVAGVLVQVTRASSGDVVARVRTTADGAFRLRVSQDSVEVRAFRIGSRPILLTALKLAPNAVRNERFVLRAEPVELPPRSTVTGTRCEARSAEGARVAASLFEQVVAALALSGGADSSVTVRLRTRRVAWTADERQQLSDRESDSTSRWPVRLTARSADDLFNQGFLTSTRAQGQVYSAPTAEFLTSARFLDEYCLYYSGEHAQDPDLVGVAFSPARGRRSVVRVSGSVWIRRSTARLESVTFAYEGLPAEEESGRPGGWMRFAPLSDGVSSWSTIAWEIRMPQVRDGTTLTRRNERSPIATTSQRNLTGVWVTSGEVVDVVRDGESSVPRP